MNLIDNISKLINASSTHFLVMGDNNLIWILLYNVESTYDRKNVIF